MRVLLVEPSYRKEIKTSKQNADDETLWYPPLGLLKIARFHKLRGDEVSFAIGCDPKTLPRLDVFDPTGLWDRVYITTLFTFDFEKVVSTIEYYKKAVGGTISKIYVGGIMASIMPDKISEATGIIPQIGVLHSPKSINIDEDGDIDSLVPDYSILDPKKYAISNTYYAYTTRGCINKCPWCGVPNIEPSFVGYIDIKPTIKHARIEFGDKPNLKLMDNNVLASRSLRKIVADLIELGYGKQQYTCTTPKKQRNIDFNQGVDATLINKDTIALISNLNIQPLRIAFDRIEEKQVYRNALCLAHEAGFTKFSNYMLYNYKDTPRDLFDRLMVNIELMEAWKDDDVSSRIYSYPMRYAPINDLHGEMTKREVEHSHEVEKTDWANNPVWTKRFARNVEIMKGAAHGAISSTPSLARRTIGNTFNEFLQNLYMPEELLRNRDAHEKRDYGKRFGKGEGSGKIELFRTYIQELVSQGGPDFVFFHNCVSQNSSLAIKAGLGNCPNKEMKEWLKLYLRNSK